MRRSVFAIALSLLAWHTAVVAVEPTGGIRRVQAGTADLGASSVRAQLMQQAQFLLQRGRPDLARGVLLKLLAVQPDDPAALLWMGDLALRDNRSDEAKRLLERLEQRQSDHPATAEMRTLWRLHTVDRLRLDQLRQLQRGGRTAQARQLARQLFLGQRPPGSLADEFAGLEGAAPNGRPVVRGRGGWVEDPAILARQRGYAALSERRHTQAQAEFNTALKRRPNDAPSLAGLGILYLREDRFAQAHDLLERAIARATGDVGDWRALSATARYWDDVGRARAALAEGHGTRAESALRDAMQALPERNEAPLLLADLQASRGQDEAALQLYVGVLAREPRNVAALRARLGVELRNARDQSAVQAALDRCETDAKAHDVTLADVYDAGTLRDTADRLASRGGDAGRVLELGVAALPADPWLRHDLARWYQRRGQAGQAEQTMAEGVRAAPRDPEMRHAAALVAMAADQEEQALAHLEAIDPAARTEAQRGLAERAGFELALRRYREALAAGDAVGADQSLLDAAGLTGQISERRLRLAGAQLGAGKTAEARLTLHTLDPASLDPEEALRWAGLVDEAGRPDAAAEVLRRLAQANPSTEGRPDAGTFQEALVAARVRWTQRRIDAALASRDTEKARQLAEAALVTWTQREPVLPAARIGQSELWMAADRPREALPWLAAYLRERPTDTRARLLQVRAWAATGRAAEAQRELDALLATQPADPEIRLEAARMARQNGRYDIAMKHLRAAAAPVGASSSVPAPAPPPEVARGIAAIEARRQPKAELGWYVATRSSTPGVSSLHVREVPLLVSMPWGYRGHVFGQLDSVRLDAGTLPAAFAVAEDFGKVLALANGADLPRAIKQDAQGLNAAVGWTDDERRVDLGVVGLGMPVRNWVGGWREGFRLGQNDLTLDVSRRPEVGSLLTYAGVHDPMTGEVWGGVTRTGVALRLGRDLPSGWSLGSSLRVGSFDGRHVQRNTAVQWRTAVDRDWLRRDDLRVNAGLVGNVWSYQRNSNFATFGHGNYYSPQRYLSIGVPVQVSGRRAAMSYLLRASVSRSWTHEADAPYYPLDAALQASAGNPVHRGGAGGGVGTSLRAAVEWQLTNRWAAGAWLDVDRSSDYAPNRAMLYVRHFFKPQAQALAVPPNPVVPYSQY